jgi:C_GCAxxG_C_C family probable redox protein
MSTRKRRSAGTSIGRRRFLSGISLAALGSALTGGCRNHPDTRDPGILERSSFDEELEKNRKMPADLMHRMLDQKVDQTMQLSWHCAQSSFLALKDQFGLEGDQVVKALTPLAGIAERGETCGAVIGPLMAMGLIFGRGRDKLGDWETYRDSLIPSGAFCHAFEERYGSTMCHGVQETKFGRCYRLTEPDELAEFQAAGATDHCSEVVRSAVRMAADIILEHTALKYPPAPLYRLYGLYGLLTCDEVATLRTLRTFTDFYVRTRDRFAGTGRSGNRGWCRASPR